MHHFLIVSWILFDAIAHHTIERGVNINECTLLVKALKDLVLARFEQPQESFRFLCYANGSSGNVLIDRLFSSHMSFSLIFS